MSTKSRSSGTRKPSREELLKELESIHQTLVSDSELDHDLLASSDSAVADTSDTQKQEQRQDMEHQDTGPDNAAKENDNLAKTALREAITDQDVAGQQSLFSSSSAKEQASADAKQQSAELLENPFLPQHIKERLEREKSLYQEQIDAAVKIPGLNPFAEKATVQDAIVDELVKIYLPQIEEELRRRLKQSSQDNKR